MYKVFKNVDKVYKSTGGIKVTVPKDCEYSIYFEKDGRKIPILDIKDHFIDPQNIGEGICVLLNKGGLMLNLNI